MIIKNQGEKIDSIHSMEYGQSSQRSESEVHRRVIYSSQLTYQQKECNKKKRVISSLGYLIGFRLLGRLQNTFFSYYFQALESFC
jgi:vacuolar-type H+-ATPase subunit E/Vma4